MASAVVVGASSSLPVIKTALNPSPKPSVSPNLQVGIPNFSAPAHTYIYTHTYRYSFLISQSLENCISRITPQRSQKGFYVWEKDKLESHQKRSWDQCTNRRSFEEHRSGGWQATRFDIRSEARRRRSHHCKCPRSMKCCFLLLLLYKLWNWRWMLLIINLI